VLAVLWAGIVLSFSQSSFAALLLGLAVLAGFRWGWRPVVAAGAAAAVVGLAVVVAAPGLVHLNYTSKNGVNRASSGRFDLIRGGVALFADRPVWGYGSGSFAKRYRAHEKASSQQAASASHTIPLTVAAEQGVVGFAAYLLVLLAAFRTLFAGLGTLGDRAPPLRALSRVIVAAAFAGLVLHTLLYAAFLEDPITWTLLALGLVLAPASSAWPLRATSSVPARTHSSIP
jgi:O-antigen ligase